MGQWRRLRHERTRPDGFIHPYMGKTCDHGGTELIAMMSEELADGRYNVTLKDPDMFAWFVGVMASV